MKILVDSVLGDHPIPEGVVRVLPAGILEDRIGLLLVVVASGVILMLVIGLLNFISAALSIRARQKLILRLKCQLFDHIQRQALVFHDNRRIGDLVYRVNNDVWGIDEAIVTVIPLFVASITLVGMFGIILSLNWQLAVLALIIAPFFYGTYGFYAKHFEKRQEKVQNLESESMSMTQEVFSAIRVVKAFNREDHEFSRFRNQGHAVAEARSLLTIQQVLYSNIVSSITVIGTAIVLGVGAYHILTGTLTLGELLVILAYLASVYGPLESIFSAATYLHSYLAKIRRITDILASDPEGHDKDKAIVLPKVDGRVTFEDVSFDYPQRNGVLQNINFDVRPGEIIGIVGPTGAGKTSLVSLIPRFYTPHSGRILLDGQDVRQIRLKFLRENISLVLQDTILFMGTIRENISYGNLDADFNDIVEAAKLANAHDFIMKFPNGYDSEVGERGVKLSGGEKQRIGIARAFLKNAPILILDEPTASLDARTETTLLEAMDRLMKHRTTFIIAHRLSTIRNADRILVIDHNHIVENGSHQDLLQLGGLYSELYRQQMELSNGVAK